VVGGLLFLHRGWDRTVSAMTETDCLLVIVDNAQVERLKGKLREHRLEHQALSILFWILFVMFFILAVVYLIIRHLHAMTLKDICQTLLEYDTTRPYCVT